MREQWDDERALHLGFAQGARSEAVFSLDGPEVAVRGRLVTDRANLNVWNYGQHKIHIVGFEFTSPGGQGAQHPLDVAIGPEQNQAIDITLPLVGLIAGDQERPDKQTLLRTRSALFSIRLHCQGLGGLRFAEVSFQATFNQAKDRLALTLTVNEPKAMPRIALGRVAVP